MMTPAKFIAESNRIEGIFRPPRAREINEFCRFMALPKVTVMELETFVRAYQPDACLRLQPGQNVRVGNHIPPPGDPTIATQLEIILSEMDKVGAYQTHLRFETLHPFTDGNGRAGRMLWAWQMQNFPLGFLHHFYYQTLAAIPARK